MLKIIGAAIIGCFLLLPTAWAVEALSTAELMSHCDKYHEPEATEDMITLIRPVNPQSRKRTSW